MNWTEGFQMLETNAHIANSHVESKSQHGDDNGGDTVMYNAEPNAIQSDGLRAWQASQYLENRCAPGPERGLPSAFPAAEDFYVGVNPATYKWGRIPADSFDRCSPPPKLMPPEASANFEAEGARVLESFRRKSNDQTLDFVSEWRIASEKRVAAGEISKEELTNTYQQINKLLNTDSPHLSATERANVAAGIMYHTGKGRIDQGLHSTCNVTVLQNIAFAEKPSLAAEMITTASLEGQWKSGDGKVITIPKEGFKPGWEEQKFPPTDGLRSHASQIFQVVALNDVGQREKEPKEFVQKLAEVGSIFHAIGSHMLPWSEYWMPNGYEVWRDKAGKETAFQGLWGNQIQEESKRLFGDKYETIAYKSPYESWSHPFSADVDGYKHTKLVESESGLRQSLSQLNQEGRLPVVVAVNGEAIMRGDSSTGDSVLSLARAIIRPIKSLHEYVDKQLGVANHVVTVSKFDAANDKVYVENSWGKDQDGWISVKDLWKAV